MNIQEIWGKRIKELRKKAKLTQEQLAEVLHIEPKQICRIETGANFTSLENIVQIAKALNVDVSELFVFEHNQNREKLLKQITGIINNASDEELQTIFKIVKDIVL